MGLEDSSHPTCKGVKDSSLGAWMGIPFLYVRLCASHGENSTRLQPHLEREELPMIRVPKMWFGLLALVFVLGLTATALAADAKGKIKSVEPDKHQFVFTDSAGKNLTMTTAKDAKVLINDKEAKLGDLKSGDEAEVTYEKVGDDLMASAIKVTRK
jgi:Cu/Ag efflux protein CusF